MSIVEWIVPSCSFSIPMAENASMSERVKRSFSSSSPVNRWESRKSRASLLKGVPSLSLKWRKIGSELSVIMEKYCI